MRNSAPEIRAEFPRPNTDRLRVGSSRRWGLADGAREGIAKHRPGQSYSGILGVEASLRQRQNRTLKDGRQSYVNQIPSRYLPNTSGLGVPEKALINHGLKWWPTKQYEKTFQDHGESANWRLEVTSLVRAEARFPASGVPFALILSIEDPEGRKPVFAEMQQSLQAGRAVAQSIRTAARVRPRG